jgi:hypothetical protein
MNPQVIALIVLGVAFMLIIAANMLMSHNEWQAGK